MGRAYRRSACTARALRFETSTWLPNLFLAGSGVLGHGVAPCLLSGRVAAAMVTAAVKKQAEPGWGSRIL